MRYSFSNALAADAAYRMRWMDFENATGSSEATGAASLATNTGAYAMSGTLTY